MKKLIKFSASSLIIFAFACFSLTSCGKQNGGANGGGNTQSDILAGSRYVSAPYSSGPNETSVLILEFRNGGTFEYRINRANAVDEAIFKGNYKVGGKVVSLTVTWVDQETELHDLVGTTKPATLSNDGKALTFEGKIFMKE